MNDEQLKEILELHEKWLRKEEDGVRANLRHANLRGANLRHSNLRGANLSGANLSGANLRVVNLSGADLRDVNLSGANLIAADLSGANLISANLSCADLTGADISYADLRDSNLGGANLRDAVLLSADLKGVKYDERTGFFALQCPESGSFTAYKKAKDYVVELLIPKTAKRSSATSRKCRANKAKVVAIYNLDRTKSNITEVRSNHDYLFIYEIGKTVSVKNFDDDRWNECSTGIHFFITFDEAKNY